MTPKKMESKQEEPMDEQEEPDQKDSINEDLAEALGAFMDACMRKMKR